jgi:hypothetical protein
MARKPTFRGPTFFLSLREMVSSLTSRRDMALWKLVCSLFINLRRLLTPEYFIDYIWSFHTSKIWKLFLLRGQLKCDGTRTETRFRLLAKRTSPFKSAGALVQSTTGSRGVRISGSNAGYTMFRGGVKGTDYPLHSSVSSSLPLPCGVTVCHHISTGVYLSWCMRFHWWQSFDYLVKWTAPAHDPAFLLSPFRFW